MTWQERFDEFNANSDVVLHTPEAVKDFISTEIIGKLIDEIPDRHKSVYFAQLKLDDLSPRMEHITIDLRGLKQQLKQRWL